MRGLIAASCLAVTLAAPAAAQEVAISEELLEQFIEMFRANLRAEKTDWLEANVPLTSEQAEVFWPLYRRYEQDRTKVGDAWLANIVDYAEHFDNLTEAKAEELLNTAFEVEQELLDVEKRHKDEMLKHLPATVVARFFQVERRLNLQIDLEAASQIPLVGTR